MITDKIKEYQEILKLQDWDISVIEVPTLGDTAQTKLLFNDYKAVVQIRQELSEAEKEITLIHELLHLIFRDAYDIFTENCSNQFAKDYCEKQHERAIEKTAKILYSLLKG